MNHQLKAESEGRQTDERKKQKETLEDVTCIDKVGVEWVTSNLAVSLNLLS